MHPFSSRVIFQLNFIGVTVERDRRYIHFNSDQFMFSPVPIGQNNCPVQVYELFNGGAMPVKYSFGLAQLEYLNQVSRVISQTVRSVSVESGPVLGCNYCCSCVFTTPFPQKHPEGGTASPQVYQSPPAHRLDLKDVLGALTFAIRIFFAEII